MTTATFKGKLLPRAFFARDVDVVARELIGATLIFNGVGGQIVETESYDTTDPASHAFQARETPRNRVMFGPPGRAYVYCSYGIHWCLNFVCGDGGAVLIRALQPSYGIERMRARRGIEDISKLCAGPGRLCQALEIAGAQNGCSLGSPPFRLYAANEPASLQIGTRIGISKARELPRRFGLTGSPFLSRRFPGSKAT